jgi:uncharacterized protein (TIGR03382 family)
MKNVTLGAAGVLLLTGSVFAQGSISEGDANAFFDGPDGIVTDLFPNGTGGLDQVFEFGWIAGVNSTPEAFLVPTTESYSGNTADFTYAPVDGVDFSGSFVLSDLFGNFAQIEKTLVITNNGNEDASVDAFSYADVDLQGSGDFSDDFAEFDGIDTVTYTDSDNIAFVLQHTAVGFNNWEIDFFDLLRTRLNDGVSDDLANMNLTGPDPADPTSAFQWADIRLAPGDSLTITASLTIPAPGAAAVFGLAGFAALRRRR